jgi:hypothetical protein
MWFMEVHDKVDDYQLDVYLPLTSTVRSIRWHNLILVKYPWHTDVSTLTLV